MLCGIHDNCCLLLMLMHKAVGQAKPQQQQCLLALGSGRGEDADVSVRSQCNTVMPGRNALKLSICTGTGVVLGCIAQCRAITAVHITTCHRTPAAISEPMISYTR